MAIDKNKKLGIVDSCINNDIKKLKLLVDKYCSTKNDSEHNGGCVAIYDFLMEIERGYEIACKNGFEDVALYIAKNEDLHIQKEKGLRAALFTNNREFAYKIYEALPDGFFHILTSGYFNFLCENSYKNEIKELYNADFFKLSEAMPHIYEVLSKTASRNDVALLEILLEHPHLIRSHKAVKEKHSPVVSSQLKEIYFHAVRTGSFKLFDDLMDFTLNDVIEKIKEIRDVKNGHTFECLVHLVEKYDDAIKETLIEKYLNHTPEMKNKFDTYFLNKKLEEELPRNNNVKQLKL